MNITVKILEVGKEVWNKTSKGGYGKITVKFEGDKGPQSRNFVSYDADIYNEIKKLVVGSTYEVRIEKEGDFWNWKEIKEVAGGGPTERTSGKATAATGTNWDARLQFDKEKQILIVRQSQVTNAIAALGAGKSVQEYCAFADKLVNYINTGEYGEVHSEVSGEEAPRLRGAGRPRKEVADIE